MNKQSNKFIIIDGNALIHRSFHAIPATMTTQDGVVINAVYGFTSFLIRSLKEFHPEYIVLTLDRKAKTFRHKEYKEYKAHRVKAPDELYAQIPLVRDVAKAFDIPVFEKDGYEADDLIGTIAKTVDHNIQKIIMTGDLDTLQLVDENTQIYTMTHGMSDDIVYDIKKINERYTLTPEQIVDYKALRGDPSDNIPGVRGIGEKGAIKLLTDFKTLDGVYKNIDSDKIKDRTRELLKQYKDNAYLSQRLATIKCDVEIDFDLEKTRVSKFDKEKIIKLFTELEFKSLLPRIKDLFTDEVVDKEQFLEEKLKRNKDELNYEIVDTDKKFEEFLKKIEKENFFTFSTETTSSDPFLAELLGISFSFKKNSAYYIPNTEVKKKEDSNLFNYLDKGETRKVSKRLKSLKGIFEDKKIAKYGHNMKHDIQVLLMHDIKTENISFDTMIASYLLHPNNRKHDLDYIVFTEMGFEKIKKEDLLGKGKNKISFEEVELEKIAGYSCESVDLTNQLVPILKKQLKDNGLMKLFEEMEMPLVRVLAEMEKNGVMIDIKLLSDMNKDLEKKLSKLEKEIHKEAGVEFNINSPKQLQGILFDTLDIPTTNIKKTKTGFSTGAEELEKLKEDHPIIPLIQEYREISKLNSTYVLSIPELVNPKTHRVHTSFNQTIAATGRLSSTNPNLQNIPIRTELGRKIREAFIVKPEFKLLNLDYSQIELRLAAHMSNDPKMIEAFNNNVDIHKTTAAEINNVALKDVTDAMRKEAKAINFGILYGQGPHGLSVNAGIPYGKAKQFIEKYFTIYKGVKEFIDNTIEMAKKNEYVETLFQRKRHVPEINSDIKMIKRAAERVASNTPLQGTAADIIKIAMIRVADLIRGDDNIKMIIQVHDELVFEVKESKSKEYAKKIANIMENIIELKVPLLTDINIGDNWGKQKPLK